MISEFSVLFKKNNCANFLLFLFNLLKNDCAGRDKVLVTYQHICSYIKGTVIHVKEFSTENEFPSQKVDISVL